ncbi:MAG TPA: DUF3300 domain-containing protein [Opitutaceae bacterium]
MKTLRATLLLASLSGGWSLAQAQTPAPQPVPATASPAPDGILMTAEQLEQLLGPIALYPDALIALILPACAASTDIVLAARQLRDNPNDRSQIEHRGWDESVKSLTSYPEVLKWLDENLSWTKQVGEAFVEQPAEAMQAVQRLRAKARAAGTLVDTPQQQVIAESSTIRIVPAQPEVIYVPYYEPEVVFVSTPVYYSRPVLAFGTGVAVGSWLAYDCDWNRRVIWCGDRRRPWHGHDWRRPVVSYAPPASTRVSITVRQWRPPPIHSRPVRPPSFTYRHTHIVRPAPIGRPSGFTPVPHTPRPTGPRRGGNSFVVNSPARIDTTPSPAPQQPRVYTRDRDGNRNWDRDRSSPRPGSSQRVVEGPQVTPPAPSPGVPQVRPQPQPRVYTQPRSRDSSVGQPAYTTPSPNTHVIATPRHQDRGGSPSFSYRNSRPASSPAVGPVQAPSTTPSAPQPSVSSTPPPQQRGGEGGNSSGGRSNNGSPGAGRGRDWRNNER